MIKQRQAEQMMIAKLNREDFTESVRNMFKYVIPEESGIQDGKAKTWIPAYAGMTKRQGFTLVEVLIALVVSLVVFLAIMQTALVSIDSNMINILRDEAVRIAEQRMNQTRNLSFATSIVDDSSALPSPRDCPATLPDGSSFTNGERFQRNLRNVLNKDFCTNIDVADLGTDNKQVNIIVGWRWKEQNYFHSISSIVRRP